MPSYEVVTPLRRNRKTVPPGKTITLDEDEARELLRKGAVVPARVAVKPPPPPPPPGPAKGKTKPPGGGKSTGADGGETVGEKKAASETE